jgi:DNA-binding MarR family transcriptional regulator
LINEFDDQIDKRTKRLSITEYGKQIRNEVFKRLGEDSVYKLAIIDKEHKLNLLTTLEKLEEYHNDLYKNTK